MVFVYIQKLYNDTMIELKPAHLEGEIEIPASKSQTIRAFLIATFARSKSIIRHPLISFDTKSCINACASMGAEIVFTEDYSIAYVDSTNALEGFDSLEIDAGNSGTTEYLLLGLAASLGVPVRVFGDKQLNSRPVGPLGKSLEDLGAEVETTEGKPPITIKGPLKGGHTTIECKTSQYLSGLLLAAPLAENDSEIDCSLLYEKPYVKITLSWLDMEGIDYTISEDLEHAKVKGRQKYKGFDSYIAGDFSSASFFFAAALISKSEVKVKGLDRNDPQGDKAILDVLEKMGAEVTWNGNEVTVKGGDRIKGGEFDLNMIPDTLPILSIVGAFADSDVHLTNVPQARIKETDRIAVMCENLKLLGVEVDEEEDGMLIHGKGRIKGGRVKGYGDHRVIMALAIASAATDEGLIIDDESAVGVTFPTFFDLFNSLKRGN